jgi:hypothetical protein
MLALLACACISVACSKSDDAPDQGKPSTGGTGSQSDLGGAGGDAADLPDSLELEAASSTDLVPRQQVDLMLQAVPAGVFEVRFALPTTDSSDPLDAALSTSTTQTDESGRVQVRLTAPSAGTSFKVRASVGSMRTELALRVEVGDEVSVQVQPVYEGNRPIATWTASARVNEKCADYAGTPPDGTFSADPVAGDALPLIEHVPAGVPVAIVLRSGHFVSGCTSLDMLPAGPPTPPQLVRVTVLDEPIQLTAADLSIALDLRRPDAAWQALFSATSATVQQALLGTSADDPDALLDAMRGALDATKRQALDQTRLTEGWDALVAAHFGAGGASRVRETVRDWLERGQAAFEAAPHLFQGSLVSVDAKTGELTLEQMAGLSPSAASVTTPSLVTWSADADDNLLLGTTLYFSASRLITGLAEVAVAPDYPQAPGAAEALAQALDCEALGATLTAAGDDADQAFDACDAACMSKLCKSAVASLWKRAREATSSRPVQLALSATAQAQVGPDAQLTAFDGEWVGQLPATSSNEPPLSTSGVLAAAERTAEEKSHPPTGE